MDGNATRQWLADHWLARCLTDALLRRRARRRLVELDHLDAGRCQALLLRGMVHRASASRFGRAHDFARIRTPADFRRLVPLRSVAQLWQEYGQKHFPNLNGVLGSEPASYLMPVVDSLGESLPFVPLSMSLLASFRNAALTALGMVTKVRPGARLLSGKVLFLSGGTAPVALNGSPAGSLEEILIRNLPVAIRPYFAWTSLSDSGLGLAENRYHVRTEEAARLPVTCIIGTASRIESFLERMRPERRPQWRMILSEPSSVSVGWAESSRPTNAASGPRRLGPPYNLRTCFRPEGIIALEDPRFGLLRLLCHGLYYEFVPAEAVEASLPPRLGIEEVQPGVTYALVVTSPAGLWACKVGLAVRFERCQPLLLSEVVEAPVGKVVPPRLDGPTLSPPRPHPRSADIPATLPGMPFHIPWSTREDRG